MLKSYVLTSSAFAAALAAAPAGAQDAPPTNPAAGDIVIADQRIPPDIVVAAVHSFFDLPREAQTERMLRAMANPHVSIVAHPTGRLIGARPAYDIDMERVIAAAGRLGCALEINAEPERLDLDDVHAHMAKSKGVKIAISTDAHAPGAFGHMRFGIDQARRAWLTADDVVNTRSLAELRPLLKRERRAAA